MNIHQMRESDLPGASLVHEATFSRQDSSLKWLECNLNAYPRFLCFVAEESNIIKGFIIWSQKSGFRKEAIVELEQVAVLPKYQSKGIGSQLIKETLLCVKSELKTNKSKLKHVIVTTRADNHAQKLYKKILGAEVEATIKDLYSSDEVVMVARNV